MRVLVQEMLPACWKVGQGPEGTFLIQMATDQQADLCSNIPNSVTNNGEKEVRMQLFWHQ